jgi:hypothetical protein
MAADHARRVLGSPIRRKARAQWLLPCSAHPADAGPWQYSAACGVLAAMLLFMGLWIYMHCRTMEPYFLHLLGWESVSRSNSCAPRTIVNSLPSFVHVAALTLAGCALLPPRVNTAWYLATFWLAANLIWECAEATVTRSPIDSPDMAAAILGWLFSAAMAMTLMQWFNRKTQEKRS